jgi:hypothetical protein
MEMRTKERGRLAAMSESYSMVADALFPLPDAQHVTAQ